MSFALSPDENRFTITTGQLAELIAKKTGEEPPTRQTIRNHRKDGKITTWKQVGKRYLFATEAVAEYLANAKRPKHGGKRKNAGRRKQAPPPPSELTRDAADAAAIRERIDERYDDNERPINGLTLDDVLRLTRPELTVLARVGLDAVGLTNTTIDRIGTIQRAQNEELKLAEKRGELVKVDRLTEAWSDSLQLILTELAALPKRAADSLSSIAWISDETVDSLCSLLHREGTDAELIDDVRSMLGRPADHAIKVRALLDSHVEGVRTTIAASPPRALTGDQ